MASTQELSVAAVANGLLAACSAAWSLQQQINALSAAWTNLTAANMLNAFNTAPLTTTGGLGTADTTPVTTHPIDTRTAPGSELAISVSSTQLAGMLTGLQGIASVIGGSAVSANGALAQLMALTH